MNDKETVLKEAALESETILSSVYLEVKKWYNEQEELKGKYNSMFLVDLENFPCFGKSCQIGHHGVMSIANT